MFDLIIADDERMMREGLSKIIDWKTLGFHLLGCFDDGRDVISYLQEKPAPDVLLMDIKMRDVSGLDVAAFVKANALPCRLVLLSAYKDFDYAKQAVEYGVSQYLLKPVSLAQIRSTFASLAQQLEADQATRAKQNAQENRYTQMLKQIRRRFWSDLCDGLILSDQLQGRAELAEYSMKDLHIALARMDFLFEDNTVWNEYLQEFGERKIFMQVEQALAGFSEQFDFYQLHAGSRMMTGCLIEKNKLDLGALAELTAAGSLEELLQNYIEMMTGLTCQITGILFFPSAVSATSNQLFSRPDSPIDHESDKSKPNFEILKKAQELKQITLDNLTEGQTEEAINYYRQFIQLSLKLGLTTARVLLTQFCSLALDRLGTGDTVLYGQLLSQLPLNQIQLLSDIDAFLYWGQEKIKIMASISKKRQQPINRHQYVEIIRDYIVAHYAENLTLNQLAAIVHLNPIYLSRFYKEQTGKTITEYITQIRMAAAVDLLNGTERYVYDIARSVGYQDFKSFVRAFRRLIGCSPTEYRQHKLLEEQKLS